MVEQKVALVAGATGLVGNSLLELLPKSQWKVYGLARRPRPSWFVNTGVEYIECDLLDRSDTLRKVSRLTDVTHLFWVVWVHKSDGEEQGNCEANGSMLSNALDALLLNAKQLEHICLQTGSKHYIGPQSLWGKIDHGELPFVEDGPRLGVPNFYYTLEDIVYDAAKKKKGLTWSIHRPSVIFGFAPRNLINLVHAVAVYASICKQQGLPFVFPGHSEAWECKTDVSDAELIAEQQIWAATDARAKNQAFNVTNGDLVTWKELWHAVALKFDLQVPVYSGSPTSMEEILRDKQEVWEEMTRSNRLHATTNLRKVARILDEAFNFPFRLVSSNSKCREFGFNGSRDTEASLTRVIDRMRAARIIP
ncbi:hypothetical protein SELMODRAFT_74346 [Selaginella moellendorffii]|uniref:PRISE-like Rossmann-fold domain-containing protein n=2 Tax=Selaginella moellendorffii TaxID=88036 RepID=D8QPI8_SELML|nr:hypothetical protein SELMODRAFT_74346 [Selaginella moellendorffii]